MSVVEINEDSFLAYPRWRSEDDFPVWTDSAAFQHEDAPAS